MNSPLRESYHAYYRWVIMANLMPWSEFEEEYAKNFAIDIGAPALPFRMALGALIIKEKLGISAIASILLL